MKVKFNGGLVTGETDLDTAQIICIPSKPRYADVDLCLRDTPNSSSVQIGEIKASYLMFEERIKIGREIERRWIGFAELKSQNKNLEADKKKLITALMDVARGPLQEPMPFEEYVKSVAHRAVKEVK